MKRYFVLAAMLAGCSSTDGSDPGDGTDGASVEGATDTARGSPPADAAEDQTADADGQDPADAEALDPIDAGDRLADLGPEPDAAPMVAIGLNVGERVPDFALPDADGQPFEFDAFLAEHGGHALVVGTSVW